MARILIGVDFSDCGRAALAKGIELALALGHDVRLVHAFPTPLQVPVAAGLGYEELFEKYAAETQTAEAIQLTTGWAHQARDAGLDVDVVAKVQSAESLILDEAHDEDVAMVVVGTNGHSGFRKFIMGSVAQAVVKRATKPTLVVPSD